MRELLDLAREVLAGREAYVVGGAVRDERLGRPLVDLDIACAAPRDVARSFASRAGGSPFPLSERHGAWRVALAEGRTVDFTPLAGSIEANLGTRDFTINAVAVPLHGGAPVDPFEGLADLDSGVIRAVSAQVYEDDPLRLLRAVRLADELDFRIESRTARLAGEQARLVQQAAGERILGELLRLSAAGWLRLADLGLLERLDGSLERAARAEAVDSPEYRLVVFLGDAVGQLPISRGLRRFAVALLRGGLPADASPRSIHRFRKRTEPWAVEALAFHGREELVDAVLAARASQPAEPLVRGDELGLPPGPEIGRVLAAIEEERAAGTISTRAEALELARRRRGR